MNIQETIKIEKIKKQMKDAAIAKYGNIMPCGPIRDITGRIVKVIDDCFTVKVIKGKKYLCFEFNTEDNGSFSVHEEIKLNTTGVVNNDLLQ